jgi:hypothetical protein
MLRSAVTITTLVDVIHKLAGGREQCVAITQLPHPTTDHLVFFWLNAELTFIVLARPLDPSPNDLELTNEDIRALPMIGDVNLFKNPREDPEFEVECE